MRIEEMEEILAKYFSGEATEEEQALVENWRGVSKENALHFLEVKELWLMTTDRVEEDDRVLENIFNEKRVERDPIMLRPWVKYASAAVLVLALSLLFLLNKLSEAEAPVDLLADGSRISLHENSKVSIVKFDENTREVQLDGKAYFDIKRDETRPFYIITENARIKVLGTSFVVDTYEEKTQVSVESGVVELQKSDELNVQLQPGEVGMVVSNNQGIIKKPNTNKNYLAWKTRKIIFEETTLSEVRDVLEDVYNVEIKFTDPAFGACSYTATLDKKPLEDVLEIISRTFGVSYEVSKKTIVFRGRGC